MQITFWGVRGSIPTPGPDTVEIGGNTSCVEVRAGNSLLVFDGGTGLRMLGKKLVKEMPLTAHIFFSHVHWDHIQGFPFFDPAFVKGNTIHLYGGNNVSRTLEETLAGQMDHPSFPVHLTDMGARMTFNDLKEGQELEIDDGEGGVVKVRTARGNHPNGVWIYRVEHGGKSIVYATDTEHYKEVDQNLVALARGVSLPALQDHAQGVVWHGPQDHMNMIRHHDPRAKFVALAVKKFQRVRNQAGDLPFAQPARAVSGVQQRLDLVAIPREQLFLLMPRQRTFGGAGLLKNGRALVLEPGDFVGREGIGETKRDEINCALFFEMRKFAAKMQPGNQRVGWRVGFAHGKNVSGKCANGKRNVTM